MAGRRVRPRGAERGCLLPRPVRAQVLIDRLEESLAGDAVAVHWRGDTNYPLAGDEVHRVLRERPSLGHLATYEEAAFRLDVFQSRPRPL